ncbi:MAG: 2'-5' RNA ligase family protein [Dehalococcoidia bacterium]
MQIIDASDRQNDAFGYSLYCLVLLAPEPVASDVQGVRDLLRPERVMIPAHVTILGTFCEIESLEFVYEQISGAMAGTDALNLVPTGDIFESPNRLTAGAVIEVSPDMRALHDQLAEAILPTAINAYMDPANFMAHLTYYQQLSESEKKRGGRITREFELSEFDVSGVTLMGRVGTSSEGEWRVVQEFPFVG